MYNESRTVAKHGFPYTVFNMLKNGAYQREHLTIRQMTKELPKGFRIRDLRGPSRQISQILVRDGHFWVILENLTAVVTAENAIMFNAEETDVQDFTSQLSDTIKVNYNLSLTPDPVYTSEPFELIVLEEMLSSVVNQYAYRINLILPVVRCLLNSFHMLTGVDTDKAVVRMIPMTNALTNFQTAISELRSAVEDVLESEEDLNKLCLSDQDRATRIEVEMLLENISKKTEELYNEVQEILLNIQTSKKAIEMIMSNTKNHLMTMTLQVSLISLTFSSAAVIGSVFGMNLWSLFVYKKTV